MATVLRYAEETGRLAGKAQRLSHISDLRFLQEFFNWLLLVKVVFSVTILQPMISKQPCFSARRDDHYITEDAPPIIVTTPNRVADWFVYFQFIFFPNCF